MEKSACLHAKLLQSCPTLCDPMDLARQVLLSMGISRQEYWSGLPCPPPGDRPNPGIESMSSVSHALQADSLSAELPRDAPMGKIMTGY